MNCNGIDSESFPKSNLWNTCYEKASNLCGFLYIEFIGMAITSLSRWCCPLAILGSIWSIRIDSINRMATRTRWHIRNKIPHIMPAITDVNPSFSISKILTKARVIAPCHHGRPQRIKWVALKPVLRSMTSYQQGISGFPPSPIMRTTPCPFHSHFHTANDRAQHLSSVSLESITEYGRVR